MALGENFASVLDAAQTGAPWAIEALYREHQPALLRYLTARAGGEGEDLASSTWLDAARNLKTFSGSEEHFRRWLFTIASRRLTDWLRQRSRRPAEPTAPEVLAEQVATTAADAADIALDALSGAEAAGRIAALLPAAQAEVVLLRVVGGLSVEDVAAATGRRPGSVRVLTHRALRKLAEEFSSDL